LNQLLIEPNYRNFVKTSYQFVEDLQIMEILNLDKTKGLLEDLTKLDVIGATINLRCYRSDHKSIRTLCLCVL